MLDFVCVLLEVAWFSSRHLSKGLQMSSHHQAFSAYTLEKHYITATHVPHIPFTLDCDPSREFNVPMTPLHDARLEAGGSSCSSRLSVRIALWVWKDRLVTLNPEALNPCIV